jgi:hypothetical protein
MTPSLPAPVAAYFAADKTDGEAVSLCFTETGTVRDEGHTYEGRAAIRRWRADVASKFTYTMTPLTVTRDGDRVVITARLAGNFPGSPVDLTYDFTLEGARIAQLQIG